MENGMMENASMEAEKLFMEQQPQEEMQAQPDMTVDEAIAIVAEDQAQQQEQQQTEPPQQEPIPSVAPQADNSALLAEMQALKAQNEQLAAMFTQAQEQQKEKLVDTAMGVEEQQPLEMPMFDTSSLAFDDEETVKGKQADYAKRMAEWVKAQTMQEISPLLQEAQRGLTERQKHEALNSLSELPELSGIADMVPRLEHIISQNKALNESNVPLEEKLLTAFLIAKGVDSAKNALQPKKEMSTEEFLALYQSKPEFAQALEKQKIEAVKEAQAVPPSIASAGIGNAAPQIPKKPMNMDEASQMASQYFG